MMDRYTVARHLAVRQTTGVVVLRQPEDGITYVLMRIC
jgi:hypothetical protein